MVRLFCKLIFTKLKTFDQVPVSLQPLVYIELSKLGYDKNGDILPTA